MHWNTVVSECRHSVFGTVRQSMMALLLAIQHRRHPEALAVFGEPRRTAASAYVAILRDAAQARGSSG
jgi:hypothetical protein